MECIDSSDDEEELLISKIRKVGYFHYIANELIDIAGICKMQDPDFVFDYRIGVALQHLADRFFRHTEVGEQYKLLKTAHINLDTEICNQFIKNARSFFTKQSDLLSIDPSTKNEEIIQLFNHLFTGRVPLTSKIKAISPSEDYKTKLLQKISQDSSFVSAIKTAFPLRTLSLIQSSSATNAAEVLAFCKLINRYIKNELKVIIATSQDSTEVDKSIQIQFKTQHIRDLNESWILRPNSKKAQNKIASLGNYSDIFEYITQDTKKSIISRIFDLLLNKETLNITGNNIQQTDKLTQLLFISELARNKAAVFTILMFLDLLESEDISQKHVKNELIDLFPMALKGAMQSSRDLINEPLLENTHSMDFNHEDQTHINLLKAQGVICRSHNEGLMKVRNLIIVANKDLRDTMSIEDILEYLTDCKEFLTLPLSGEIESLKTQYKEVLGQETLEQKKVSLNNYFPEKTTEIGSASGNRSITKLIAKLFYNKVNIMLAEFGTSKELIKQLNCKIIESLKGLYNYSLQMYGIKGFAEELISAEKSDEETLKSLKRENEDLEGIKSKIAKSEAMSDVHNTVFDQSLQKDDITTYAMGSGSNLDE